MKFSISGVVYDATDLDLVSLKDILIFEVETADMGRPFFWSEIEEISNRISKLDEAAVGTDPGLIWLTAVTVWASRRAKGEPVTFSEAVDFPMRDLVMIPDPQDHPTKKTDPTKARPGSGRAAKRSPASAVSVPSLDETSVAASTGD